MMQIRVPGGRKFSATGNARKAWLKRCNVDYFNGF
jgi:hypothetical protein